MFCKYCGKQIDDNSTFCNFCGKNLTSSIQGTSNGTSMNGIANNAKWESIESNQDKSAMPSMKQQNNSSETINIVWEVIKWLAIIYVVGCCIALLSGK